MSNHDDDRPEDDGVYQSAAGRGRGRRRRNQIAVGIIGLGAVLGAGAYLITAQVIDHQNSTVTTDAGPTQPPMGAADSVDSPTEDPSLPVPSPSVSVSVPSGGSTKSGVKQSTSPAPSLSLPPSMSVEEQIRQAREKAAADGYPVQKALTAGPNVPTGPVDERTEKHKGGILRVITARHDLTGQRELLWPANGGKRVGDAECTQTFRFSNNDKASTKPNLLLCWKTSAKRSVITMMIDQDGKPSGAESVKVIDQEWAKLD
ncbi:hypothetical protein [Paractinoplanes durhamensis]|uniref:Uncharacterized protein n=1 Tax=Paractinoplanes durhamensis TaxID=113563 RepID=A0ABQ3Z9Q4_9ACTN|nr:hypothetical protein [Actinoplanes durhamensis]GIE06578.1 hypothetical protein Adu01nite_79280 [Actinoplanes durhamensis]